MIKQAVLAATLVVGATVSAHAVPVTLFQDNFNGEAKELNAALDNWSVTNGTIDVIGTGFFDFNYGIGGYLDMDGSNLNAGRITTNSTFNLEAGKSYTISFDYGKNGSAAENLIFGIGSYTSSLILAAGGIGSLVNEVFTFVATADELNVSLFFEDLGGDNQGVVLDNVSLSAVPLPAAAPLFLMGLAGLGAMARRRRAKISV